MKINRFPCYYAALIEMAECAINDRISFLDCQPKMHDMQTDEEREDLKKLIHETTLEISDYRKIQANAKSRIKKA